MRDIKKYADVYSTASFENYQINYRRKKILEFINLYNSTEILEIGCGPDPIAQYLSENYHITIVEPSEEYYELVKSLEMEADITVINSLFENAINNLISNYDFIICSSLLHELEDSDDMLSKIRETANENTIIHINVPNANSIHRLIAYECNIIDNLFKMTERNNLLQQHNIYDLDKLKKQVERNGFNIIESGSFFIKPFTHTQMHQMIQAEIINEQILDGLYAISKYIPDMGSEIYVNVKKA